MREDTREPSVFHTVLYEGGGGGGGGDDAEADADADAADADCPPSPKSPYGMTMFTPIPNPPGVSDQAGNPIAVPPPPGW